MTTSGDRPRAVAFDQVSVCFRIPKERIATIKEYAIRRLMKPFEMEDFWAIRGIGLDVYAGEVLGVVGCNGAGKSTLLKLAARVLKPTTGRVRVWGRVAPLLELGAGFDPELTGRENILLNGTILGATRSAMKSRVEAIIEFAELTEFIDVPLRNYSSGMVARLGFAIATDARPDILVVDEVLAVGDAHFQRKSLARIAGFREGGATILIVSHDVATLRMLCDRVAWIDRGALVRVGPGGEVLEQYGAHSP